jgi:hypothetical protein
VIPDGAAFLAMLAASILHALEWFRHHKKPPAETRV